MKLAIMQPYLLPYIGYFQLIHATDQFIIYDDVNFIKQGWINRNKITLNNREHFFTLPLTKQSSNELIQSTMINKSAAIVWLKKFKKSIEQNFKKSDYFEQGNELLSEIEHALNLHNSIAEVNEHLIRFICNSLGINTEIITSSQISDNKHLSGKHRVIDTCLRQNASTYINVIGGKELYHKEEFQLNNINLFFLDVRKDEISNFNSVLELFYTTATKEIKKDLVKYELI
jgi:hypothetical protein